MKSLIVPCAGRSSRYPNTNPKYLLTHPNGGVLVLEGLKGLDLNSYDKIYVTILKSHDINHRASEILNNAFEKCGLLNKLCITVLETETKSQPETIVETIKKQNITGAILIKDCDDYFEGESTTTNAVYVYSLAKIQKTNATNKSYITTNNSGYIDNIVEKRVISEDFCCGGYAFKSAEDFVKYYDMVSSTDNLYISHIIYVMLMHGISFTPISVEGYCDWGTLDDWREYKAQYKTLFVDLDGVLVENSSQYSTPAWGSTPQIQKNCEYIRQLHSTGKTQIIITTARSEDFREITLKQLERENIPYDQIIFGLYHTKRYIINDFATTNAYPSCEAINLVRNANNLSDIL